MEGARGTKHELLALAEECTLFLTVYTIGMIMGLHVYTHMHVLAHLHMHRNMLRINAKELFRTHLVIEFHSTAPSSPPPSPVP